MNTDTETMRLGDKERLQSLLQRKASEMPSQRDLAIRHFHTVVNTVLIGTKPQPQTTNHGARS